MNANNKFQDGLPVSAAALETPTAGTPAVSAPGEVSAAYDDGATSSSDSQEGLAAKDTTKAAGAGAGAAEAAVSCGNASAAAIAQAKPPVGPQGNPPVGDLEQTNPLGALATTNSSQDADRQAQLAAWFTGMCPAGFLALPVSMGSAWEVPKGFSQTGYLSDFNPNQFCSWVLSNPSLLPLFILSWPPAACYSGLVL